jgi:hypothetical protein
MSYDTLKTKVEQLIEKAQSSGGGESQGIIFDEVDANGYPIKVTIPANSPQTHSMFRMKGQNYGMWRKLTEINYNHCLAPIGEELAQNCNSLVNIINVENVTEVHATAFSKTVLSYFPFGEGLKKIGSNAFRYIVLKELKIPSSVTNIDDAAFGNITTLKEVTFKGTPTTVNAYSFVNCNNITDIYVPWAEGAVANAPWGATNATIHYNSEV